jgi:glutaredoxin
MHSILLMALAMAMSVPAAAQVYKWTDSTGKVHYGDRPPDDARNAPLKLPVTSYDGPVKVTDWAAIIRRKPPPQARAEARAHAVTLYSATWCVHCKRARSYFNANGIRFNEVDVEATEAGRNEFADLGGGGVPLILVGDRGMRGFDERALQALLQN